MADVARPMLRRLELGNALRRLRDERGMTIAEVTEAMRVRFGSSFSPTKLSRMETARRGAVPRDVHDLCVLYDVDPGERERLIELAKSARKLDDLQVGLNPGGYGAFIALEQLAVRVRTYSCMVLPGLHQTVEYSTMIEKLDVVAPPGFYRPGEGIPERSHDRVILRSQRQQLLTGEQPLLHHAILDENVILRRTADPGVMRGQLATLLERLSWPNIRLQIIPLEAGIYPASETATWHLLDFPDEPNQPARTGYMESIFGGRLIERESEVARLAEAFGILEDTALSPELSRQRIEQALARVRDWA
ncbi:helix-turn-helix domain-containing protein [Actinospica durhamensis]|uniref:Helix-turn-helix domain-containing protein n=1 Tax=Actinospica durhamensis TaxID=1508375 RepID=A0A941IRZ5_9ACTN|nr:helix-turn-helix transcriptional regulator [Actinospica durhamensis]MBR7839355.1 helix-turn-helix domain-containing protein [Actinospica durhamensis]